MNWQIPNPYEPGIENWQLADAGLTQRLGAPNEVDENGIVREICVVSSVWVSNQNGHSVLEGYLS